MKTAVIAVGSNIDPRENIAAAEEMLKRDQTLKSKSRFVQTCPRGYTDQDDFVNGAFLIETEFELDGLKQYCKEVEAKLGRIRTENKNGPRTIDLDVTVFDGQIVDGDFYQYDFVKNAVLELMPELEGEPNGNQ